MESLFNRVYKVPLRDLIPGIQTNAQKEFAVVTEVNNQRKILNLCSAGYQLVENYKIVEHVEQMLERVGFKYEMSYKQYGNAKFFIDFTIDNQFNLPIMKNDRLIPRLRIVNSYDGSVKYSAIAGVYRLICSNGLVIPYDQIKRFRKRHTKQLEGDESIKLALEVIGALIEDSESLLEPYMDLMEAKVFDAELRIEEVVEHTSFPKNLSEQVLDRINEEQKSLHIPVVTDWLVYNGFNYQLNHNYEDSTIQDHKRERIDLEVMDYLLTH